MIITNYNPRKLVECFDLQRLQLPQVPRRSCRAWWPRTCATQQRSRRTFAPSRRDRWERLRRSSIDFHIRDVSNAPMKQPDPSRSRDHVHSIRFSYLLSLYLSILSVRICFFTAYISGLYLPHCTCKKNLVCPVAPLIHSLLGRRAEATLSEPFIHSLVDYIYLIVAVAVALQVELKVWRDKLRMSELEREATMGAAGQHMPLL